MRSSCSRVGPNPTTGVLVRRGGTHRETLLEIRAMQPQAKEPAISHQTLEDEERLFPWQGAQPCRHLGLDFLPPELWKNVFLLLCGPLLWQPSDTNTEGELGAGNQRPRRELTEAVRTLRGCHQASGEDSGPLWPKLHSHESAWLHPLCPPHPDQHLHISICTYGRRSIIWPNWWKAPVRKHSGACSPRAHVGPKLPSAGSSFDRTLGTRVLSSHPSGPYALPFSSLPQDSSNEFPIICLRSSECLDRQPKSFPPAHQQVSALVLTSGMSLSCLIVRTLPFLHLPSMNYSRRTCPIDAVLETGNRAWKALHAAPGTVSTQGMLHIFKNL